MRLLGDLTVSNGRKVGLLELGWSDPGAAERIARRLAASPGSSLTVAGPIGTSSGGTIVTAKLVIRFDGHEDYTAARFVRSPHGWQLSYGNTCELVDRLHALSPACPE